MKNIIKQFFSKLISLCSQIIFAIPALIYDAVYSRYVTKQTYVEMLHAFNSLPKFPESILDVGIGPGGSLNYIINEIPKTTQIIGVDYNKFYV